MSETVRAKKQNKRKTSRLIFYICGMALPVLQFCIFYIYINFNSFALAFQKYETVQGQLGYQISFAGFENFRVAWETLTSSGYMIKNSLIFFLFNTVLGITLALLFSYYIYKRYLGAGLFKVILFIPKIIPAVVFCLLFKFMVTDCYSAIATALTGKPVLGLFDNNETVFATVVVYNIWISFGVNVILFSGAMSNINESIVESAQLDGANTIQELWYITLPMIFKTLTTFIIVGMAGVFTHQMSLYTLFGLNATHMGTLGYFLYINALKSGLEARNAYLSYSELSALGLILTAIACPITLGVRALLEKFGPRTD